MSAPGKVALLFIDGVGVGERDPITNPLAEADLLFSQFSDGSGTRLPRGGVRIDVDTTFGVAGRPQSASNQTALLTGLPAPSLVGAHVLGFPTKPLVRLLEESSIIKQLAGLQKRSTCANAYPVAYLDALKLPRRSGSAGNFELSARTRRRLKPPATALAFAAGQVPLRTLDDVLLDAGLTHDIDSSLAQRRFHLPARTPEQAAQIFWKVSEDFTFFEYSLADEAGHEQDRSKALTALTTFDRFAREVVRLMPDEAQVLMCSDHGNVEDLSTRNHTTNPVAVLSFGRTKPCAMRTLADVGRSIVSQMAVAESLTSAT